MGEKKDIIVIRLEDRKLLDVKIENRMDIEDEKRIVEFKEDEEKILEESIEIGIGEIIRKVMIEKEKKKEGGKNGGGKESKLIIGKVEKENGEFGNDINVVESENELK